MAEQAQKLTLYGESGSRQQRRAMTSATSYAEDVGAEAAVRRSGAGNEEATSIKCDVRVLWEDRA